MANDSQTGTTQGFLISMEQVAIETEEQALTVYYQMRSYPELKLLLDQHAQTITQAIQSKNTPLLISVIQKVQSDFLRAVSEQPYQVQLDTEKKIADAQRPPEEITTQVESVKRALGKTHTVAESLCDTKRAKNKEFISKLVKNYSSLTPAETDALTNAIVSEAETHPDSPPQEVVKRATKTIPNIPQSTINKLTQQREVVRRVQDVQNNPVSSVEQRLIRAVLDSPEPDTTLNIIQTHKDAEKDLPVVIQKAERLTQAAVAAQVFTKETPNYSGFFSTISKSGSLVEKTLAPLTDTIFSFFPQKIQEAVVVKVLGASWTKEVSNNAWLQQGVGPLLQSAPIQQAIKTGNTLFQTSNKGVILTKTQIFFMDIFVTIFHPEVSEVYLQLASAGKTQMGQSVGAYYAGLAAQQGFSVAAKKGAKVVETKVAEKAAGTTIGKFIGGILGGEGGPVGSFLGALLFDKILGGLWSGVKKGFNFITLGWLGNLITGNYESAPLTKDPVFIVSLALVGSVLFLFVTPLLPITFVGNSFFQQEVQDNAYIAGLGGGAPGGRPGINTGAGFSCTWSGATPPKTSISHCPVHAPITQGPNTTAGSHVNTEAYDFGSPNGTPIHAAQDGYVSAVVTTFQPNQFENKSFGNNVVLVGTDASGQIFCTIYAHLLDVSPATIGAFQNKTVIHAGDIIGYSDTTGYTYGYLGLGKGPHLHFGYKGSGSIALPAGCP